MTTPTMTMRKLPGFLAGTILLLSILAHSASALPLPMGVPPKSSMHGSGSVSTAVTPLIFDQLSSLPSVAWSSRQLKRSFIGTPMAQTSGVVTALNDQIGTNNAAAAGSPVYDSAGANGHPLAVMDGTATKFTPAAPFVLTADFDVWAALCSNTLPLSQTLIGRSGNSAPYIRPQGASGILISVRSDSGANADVTPTANWKKGCHVWRWKRVSTTVTEYIDGVSMGTATQAGTFTINVIGMNNGLAFLKMSLGELSIWNGTTLAGADEANLLSNMLGAWRSPIFVDSVAGNDSNVGWNSGAPLASLSSIRTLPYLPGQSILLKSGSTWRRDDLFIAQSNAAGVIATPITVSTYGGSAPAILLGSEQITSGWTQVLGDVWQVSVNGTQPSLWLLYNGATYRMTSISTTFGALNPGEAAISGGVEQINMPTALTGISPNAMVAEHAWALSGQDNVHLSNAYWGVSNIETLYGEGDGFRLNGAGTGCSFCVARWNAQDGVGLGCTGAAKSIVSDSDSEYNGSGDTPGNPDGDGFSAHGQCWGQFIRDVASHNDKSEFNHEESTTIEQDDCIGSDANIPIGYLDQPGTNKPGNWIIKGGSYAAKSGPNTLPGVVNMVSSNHTHGGDGTAGGGTITMSNVTLIDVDGTHIGVYGYITAYGDVTATGTLYSGIASGQQQQNLGHGTFTIH